MFVVVLDLKVKIVDESEAHSKTVSITEGAFHPKNYNTRFDNTNQNFPQTNETNYTLDLKFTTFLKR